MSGIAKQILSEASSQPAAPVSADSEQTPENQAQPQKTDDFDSRFNLLAKMERKLKEQESQYKSRDREWEEKGKKLTEYEELMRLMDENPLEAIKKRKGWGLQELNEFAVKHSSDDDLDPVAQIHKTHAQKMEELEKKLMGEMEAKLKAKEEEIRAREYEGEIKQFKSGIKTFLVDNKDQYEFINAEETGADSVYELIYEDILRQQEGGVAENELKIMDVKEAAEKVEAFLDKQYSKFLSLNKVKSRLNGSDERNDIGQFIAQSRPRTIDSSFSPKSKTVDQLSPQERRQAAIDMLRSQTAT